MDYTSQTPRHSWRLYLGAIFVVMFGLVASVTYMLSITLNTPPDNFPVGVDITIEEGHSVRDIANQLAQDSVVRSSLYIYAILARSGNDTGVQAGVYRFDAPITSGEVMTAITEGTSMSPHISVTFPEGFSAHDIYTYLPSSLEKVPYDITEYEGYLFPDTYFIAKGMTAEDLFTLMRETFTEKIAPYTSRIEASTLTLEEVVTLASIIEREAKDTESKKIVSGILQNRLAIDMPLQVDAVFDYLLDKTSAELTEDDLETDSPYNTYLYRGLPPGPIANPGLESIEAVLEPTETKYLYYLTGDNGNFYYARTFEEHKLNKARYLK